jgi:DNA-binding transcriptional LysR family regulator
MRLACGWSIAAQAASNRRSVAAFDELKQSIRDIEFLSDRTAGEVRIGAPNALAGFVAAVIQKFTREYPRLVCRLPAWGDYRALEEREVDLTFTLPIEPIDRALMDAEVLYAAPRFVIAAKKNPWSRRRRVRLADLMNEPWALPSPESPQGALDAETFRAAGLELPAAAVVADGAGARLALVAGGRFLTIVSDATLRFAGWGMAVAPLSTDMPDIRNPVGIVTLKNRTLTPVAQLFIDCAREVAKPLATGKSVSTRHRRVQQM